MSLFILYLDEYHQGDTLFLRGLAGQVREGGVPTMIVHGGGETAERHLEANGFFPERGADGQWTNLSVTEHSLIEQATRMANRTLTGLFNDHVVSVVGVQGTDRRLIQVGKTDSVKLGRADWLMEWAEKQVVPMISALAVGPDGETVLVAIEQVVGALREHFADANPTVVMFSKKNRQGLQQNGELVDSWRADELTDTDQVQAVQAAQWLVQQGAQVLVTSPTGLYRKPEPKGTRLIDDHV